MSITSKNIKLFPHSVTSDCRFKRQGHKGGIIWLTGLPGSGKSTLAFNLERCLFEAGFQAYAIDGDNLRHGLNSDLGFSSEDRIENTRRVSELALLYADAGLIAITAIISPFRSARQLAREVSGDFFHEVYLSASIEICEGRDPKGHYKKARAGEIPDFTGVSSTYEQPNKAELVIDTGKLEVDDCLDILLEYVDNKFRL